jgi:hypothetical protein
MPSERPNSGKNRERDEDENPKRSTSKTPRKREMIEDEDDEEQPAPKKRKAPSVDDDGEAPTQKKRKRPVEDDEDEEPAPKKRKRPVEDDEEEPTQKKRKRPVDVDDEDDEEERPRKSKKKSKEAKKPAIPMWAMIAGPIALVGIIVLVIVLATGKKKQDDGGDTANNSKGPPPPVQLEAVAIQNVNVSVSYPDIETQRFFEQSNDPNVGIFCDAPKVRKQKLDYKKPNFETVTGTQVVFRVEPAGQFQITPATWTAGDSRLTLQIVRKSATKSPPVTIPKMSEEDLKFWGNSSAPIRLDRSKIPQAILNSPLIPPEAVAVIGDPNGNDPQKDKFTLYGAVQGSNKIGVYRIDKGVIEVVSLADAQPVFRDKPITPLRYHVNWFGPPHVAFDGNDLKALLSDAEAEKRTANTSFPGIMRFSPTLNAVHITGLGGEVCWHLKTLPALKIELPNNKDVGFSADGRYLYTKADASGKTETVLKRYDLQSPGTPKTVDVGSFPAEIDIPCFGWNGEKMVIKNPEQHKMGANNFQARYYVVPVGNQVGKFTPGEKWSTPPAGSVAMPIGVFDSKERPARLSKDNRMVMFQSGTNLSVVDASTGKLIRVFDDLHLNTTSYFLDESHLVLTLKSRVVVVVKLSP